MVQSPACCWCLGRGPASGACKLSCSPVAARALNGWLTGLGFWIHRVCKRGVSPLVVCEWRKVLKVFVVNLMGACSYASLLGKCVLEVADWCITALMHYETPHLAMQCSVLRFPTSRQLETVMLANLEQLLLPGTKKVPKIYALACHPLQPHLLAVGANAGACCIDMLL